MELNKAHNHAAEDEDRLSAQTDDILLSILSRVDIITAARTSVLSTRWKNLPWLLHELNINVKDFLPVPCPNTIEREHMDEAMASLIKAIRSFLVTNRREATILRLQLKLYLVNNCSDVIGPLLSEAIDTGTVNDFDLAILYEKEPDDCRDEEVLQQACLVDGFFSSYPSVLHCLTKLSLYNVCFAKWDMHHLLFDCCKELQYLYLSNCDAGTLSTWKIHAPNSKLSVLELEFCCLSRLEVLCLPNLKRFFWDTWVCPNAPVTFDIVPSLKELNLLCAASIDHQEFMLNEVLSDTAAINDLTLNFQGEKLWIQPEGKRLCAAFNKLKKLSLHGIFVEFDLLWTIFLLEAAPLVEIFDIEVWEHPCTTNPEVRRDTYGERTNPSWKSEFKSCKEWLLKEVQITGFCPMKQQMTFIRAVMERAAKLKTVVLKDYQPCQNCEKIGALPRFERLPPEYIFPKDKEEQDLVAKQLIGDMYSHIQIVFVC
ncbi:hypothetical protein ACP70R_004876 [Stipagrostis hirtigluma subsp. patula]